MPCSADLRRQAAELGFCALGAARVLPVDDEAAHAFRRWTASGMNGCLDYMERYADVRANPSLLLSGASTLLMAAASYYHADQHSREAPPIAAYAHGRDYHVVMRQRLEDLAAIVRERYGGSTRVCVDTAPLRERYWAVRAGIGFIGRNAMLIVPGFGSYVFLGAILSTVPFTPDKPINTRCGDCGRCVANCPAGALVEAQGAFVDATRCLSCLTIEKRGPLPPDTDLHGRLYGCDTCQKVCPWNSHIPETPFDDFRLRPALRGLTPERVMTLTHDEYAAMFRHSAVKRAKLEGLRRNAAILIAADKSSPLRCPGESSSANEDSDRTPLSAKH